MNHEDAYRVLAIRPPFTETQLRSAYRAAALLTHPDRGGDQGMFVQVKEAFELLVSDAGRERVVDPIRMTVDGRRLDTLGKGLKTSAKKCVNCGGDGYLTAYQEGPCPECWRPEMGIVWLYNHLTGCRTCGGRGTVKRAALMHLLCTFCDGTGEIALFNPVMVRNGLMTQKERKASKR